MRIFKKVTEALTGKTEIERKQEKLAMKEIRRQINAERLRTRRDEALKFARESEKIRYQRRLETLKNPKISFLQSPNYSQGLFIQQPKQNLSIKKKLRKPATREVYKKFDVLGL
jgi:hypothetical protein